MIVEQREGLGDRLRRETRHLHRAVEHRLLHEGWLEDLAAYRSLLGRLYGLHLHVESAVQRFAAQLDGVDLQGCAHGGLLRADLAGLGAAAGREQFDRPPLLVADASEVLGALYVLEGSTLGGQVICRLLSLRLGLSAAAGASGLDPYGNRTVERWAAFVGGLNGWPGNPDRVIAGACSLFACFDTWVLGAGLANNAVGEP